MNTLEFIAIAFLAGLLGGAYGGSRIQKNADIAAQVKASNAAQAVYEARVEQERVNAYAASDVREKEIARLRSEHGAIPTVLVRFGTASVQMPSLPSTGEFDAAGETGGVLPGEPQEVNIGPGLQALMLEADECSATLRGLQLWATGLSR